MNIWPNLQAFEQDVNESHFFDYYLKNQINSIQLQATMGKSFGFHKQTVIFYRNEAKSIT